jgi:4,4'-diaponeurosporenoate glycosyltransferase
VTGFEIAALAYIGALWLPGIFCLWRVPRLPPAGPPAHAGDLSRRVSVIVPARNEERRISPLLESLARQGRPADEVIVVDDESTDGTASLARRLGARVIIAPPRPEGWVGKTWACWTGAQEARGDLLVFLDADTRLEREGLERILAAYRESGGLVSVQPYHEVHRAYERLSAFFNVVLMGSLGAFTPLGGRLRSAGSFGPCIAISRQDYFGCGGHAAVSDRVAEDVALGNEARRRGMNVACIGGRGAVSFRMYAGGLGGMIEGWCKCMAAGAGASSPFSRSLMALWLTGMTTSVIAFCWGIAALCSGGESAAFGAVAIGLYVLYAVQLWWMLRRIGSFGPLTALMFPVPLAFFHAVFARSVWLTQVRGSVTWRGRQIDTRASRRQGSPFITKW